MVDELTSEEKAQFEAMKAPPEAAESPQAQPETEVEVDGAEPAAREQPEHQKMVPHGALHEERARRKRAEEDLRALRERMAYFEGQAAARKPPEPQEPDLPNPEDDPIGAIKAQQEFIRRQIASRRDMDQQQQVARQQQELISSATIEWDAYKRENPDAEQAYKHIRETRGRELLLMGVEPARANQILNAEEFQAMQAARRSGRNIGEYVVELAQYRGWQKPTPQPRQDGKEAAKSLSGLGGSPTGPMTAERLASMTVEEFEAYQTKNPATVRRLMGG